MLPGSSGWRKPAVELSRTRCGKADIQNMVTTADTMTTAQRLRTMNRPHAERWTLRCDCELSARGHSQHPSSVGYADDDPSQRPVFGACMVVMRSESSYVQPKCVSQHPNRRKSAGVGSAVQLGCKWMFRMVGVGRWKVAFEPLHTATLWQFPLAADFSKKSVPVYYRWRKHSENQRGGVR